MNRRSLAFLSPRATFSTQSYKCHPRQFLPGTKKIFRTGESVHRGPISPFAREQNANQRIGVCSRVGTIKRSTLITSKSPVDLTTEPSFVCSYSFDKHNRIYVPGAPERFQSPPSLPLKPGLSETKLRSELLSHLELNCIALPEINLSFNFSPVDIYCNHADLVLFWKLANNRFRQKRRFHVYLVHGTLVIHIPGPGKSRIIEDINGDRGPQTKCSVIASLKTSSPGIPADSVYFQTVQYELGDVKCAVWSHPSAYVYIAHDADERASYLTPSDPAVGLDSEDAKACTILIRAGEIVAPTQLVKIRTHDTHPGASDLDTSQALISSWLDGVANVVWAVRSENNEIVEVSHQNAQDEARKCTVEMQPSFQRLIALIHNLKDMVKTSQHGICVVVATSINDANERLPEPVLEVWEPEFDEKVLNEQQVPSHYRVQREIFSKDFVQQFWVDNKRSVDD